MTNTQKLAVVVTSLLAILYIAIGLSAGHDLRVSTERLTLPEPAVTAYKDNVAAYNTLNEIVEKRVKAQYDLDSEATRHILDAFLATAVALLFGKGVQTLAVRRLEMMTRPANQSAQPAVSATTEPSE